MDFWLDWNGDYVLTPNGSIQPAVGWDQTRQRITRRLLTTPATVLPDGSTTPPGYIFQPDFGIGLAQQVDQPTDLDQQQEATRHISRGVLEDSDVLSTSPPTVLYDQVDPQTVRIVIGVTLLTGKPGTIALSATA
jgi:hypothetical protein